MNSLSLIKELLEQVMLYEANAPEKENLSIDGFWASTKKGIDLSAYENNLIEQKTQDPTIKQARFNIDRIITQHILFLYRYVKFYSKFAFENLPIKTIDEFSILITAMQFESIPKTELIKKNILEKSSGIEIIKRLIKSGYLKQFDNPDDQRSQLISLTQEGRNVLFACFQNMEMLGTIATGTLSQNEKETLTVLLKKLDDFHFENYHQKVQKSLEDYLPN